MRRIIEKLLCMHDWEVVRVVSYPDCDKVLLACKKCGRIARKRI